MNTLTFRNVKPLRCVKAVPEGRREPQRGQLFLGLSGSLFSVDLSLLDRGDAFSAESVYNGVLLLLSDFAHDQQDLVPYGYSPAWAEDLRHNNEEMYHMWLARKATGFEAGVERFFATGEAEEAQALARTIVGVATAGRVREVFFSDSADWRTKSGLFLAVYEIDVKSKVPALRKVLLDLGVTEAQLARVGTLREELHKARFADLSDEAAQRAEMERVRLLRGMLVEDASTVCATAKVALSDNRAALYQVGRLFGASRARSERPPTPPVVTPTPPVITPVPPVVGPTMPTLSGAAVPAPGTVLATLPAAGGPALHAIVQPDGHVAWVPAPMTATAVTHAAAPPPAPRRARRPRAR